MRRIWAALSICGLVLAVAAACGPAEKPTPPEPEVVAEPAKPAEPGPGSFEEGKIQGWDRIIGDPTRTDFETGDARSWSDAEGGDVNAGGEDDDG